MYAAGATEWVASRSVDRSKILANGSEPKRRPFVDGFVMTLSNRLGTETAVKTPEATDHILWDPCIHSGKGRTESKKNESACRLFISGFCRLLVAYGEIWSYDHHETLTVPPSGLWAAAGHRGCRPLSSSTSLYVAENYQATQCSACCCRSLLIALLAHKSAQHLPIIDKLLSWFWILFQKPSDGYSNSSLLLWNNNMKYGKNEKLRWLRQSPRRRPTWPRSRNRRRHAAPQSDYIMMMWKNKNKRPDTYLSFSLLLIDRRVAAGDGPSTPRSNSSTVAIWQQVRVPVAAIMDQTTAR